MADAHTYLCALRFLLGLFSEKFICIVYRHFFLAICRLLQSDFVFLRVSTAQIGFFLEHWLDAIRLSSLQTTEYLVELHQYRALANSLYTVFANRLLFQISSRSGTSELHTPKLLCISDCNCRSLVGLTWLEARKSGDWPLRSVDEAGTTLKMDG